MNQTPDKFYIDDITWNDLSMEQIYEKINTSQSSVGQEHLKSILRNELMDVSVLEERSDRAEYFSDNKAVTDAVRKIYKGLGKTKKVSLYDYIFRFDEIKASGNGAHYLMIILLLAAIAMIFIQPVIGIIALVVMFVINISSYFKYKASVESYFMCFKYIVRMVRAASSLLKLLPSDDTSTDPKMLAFSKMLKELKEDISLLAPMKRGSWLLTNSISGSLVDVIMDYVRMLFHVDIIKFNSMRKLAAQHSGTIDHLFCTLGEIESDICISDFRHALNSWSRPFFFCNESEVPGNCSSVSEPDISDSRSHSPEDIRSSSGGLKRREVVAEGIYHPLTPEIVKNDIHVRKSILLTGSNASGKSTFLKQVAICQILAQTIYTCPADTYRTNIYKVLSSMALADNILGSESYFIVEIKSLKRIFDQIDNTAGAVPVMCFIDEVLRGTNTRERIAASGQILKKMSELNALCFAATHDIELTELLKDDMDNYHFEEYVQGNDVRFDYKIKPGPATTRNAIRLMQAYGFDPDIIEAAYEMAGR